MKNLIALILILGMTSGCAFTGMQGRNKLYATHSEPIPREKLNIIKKGSPIETMDACAGWHEKLSGTPYLISFLAIPGAGWHTHPVEDRGEGDHRNYPVEDRCEGDHRAHRDSPAPRR